MPSKNSVNTNFARAVSNPLNAPLKNEQDGTEPITNLRGALYVDTSGGPAPTAPTYLNKIYSHSPALGNSLFFTPGAFNCDLLEVSGFKSGTAALRFLQFFNLSILPPNGTIPLISIPLAGANTIFSLSYPPLYKLGDQQFTAGAFAALSDTPATLTLSLVGTFWLQSLVGKY